MDDTELNSPRASTRPAPLRAARIWSFREEYTEQLDDLLVSEAPLEIRLEYGPADDRRLHSLAVTMRTPGQDLELALGWMLTEGIASRYEDILQVRPCTDGGRQEEGLAVRVSLAPGIVPDWKRLERAQYASAACGLCGKTSFSVAEIPAWPDAASWAVAPSLIYALPERLRQAQALFGRTGGLHAAALFSPEGELLLLREDIGRHNAVDKVIGAAWAKGWMPLQRHILFLSGRAGFELIQKGAMAGLAMIAAVGAPSALAVETAEAAGISLCGFVRERRFNLYSHPQRIKT